MNDERDDDAKTTIMLSCTQTWPPSWMHYSVSSVTNWLLTFCRKPTRPSKASSPYAALY